MPRLSLYKPEHGNDYKFMDKVISEAFTVGGTDLYFHKYIGSNTASANATADQPHYSTDSPTNIQDLLLLENRDRKYDPSIYRIRGHYNVANIDFNLSQFGLFLDNDTIYMTVHINDIIASIGRKPMSGDVFELPHLRDNFALADWDIGLPRYYQVTDVGRASEGFSATWYPHLYRLKCTKITNSQQFADILKQVATDVNGDPDPQGNTLGNIMSNLASLYTVNDAVIQQGEADAAKSGFETQQFYTLAVDPSNGKPVLETVNQTGLNASNASNINASSTAGIPVRTGYTGYLVGDGFPQNGYDFGFGIQFPANAQTDDFFLRTDFLPNRLFRFDGNRWIKVEDAVRMNMTNTDTRQTQKTSFINNDNNYIFNDAAIQTYIMLTAGAYVIQTKQVYNASYLTAPYIGFKLDTTELSYTVADYPTQTLVSSYTSGSNTYLQITLPTIPNSLGVQIQQTIPYDGQWKVGLYKNRESIKQSLSTALRPKADF